MKPQWNIEALTVYVHSHYSRHYNGVWNCCKNITVFIIRWWCRSYTQTSCQEVYHGD